LVEPLNWSFAPGDPGSGDRRAGRAKQGIGGYDQAVKLPGWLG